MPAAFMKCTRAPGSTVRTIKRGGKRVVICKDSGGKWHSGHPHADKKKRSDSHHNKGKH